MMIRSTAMLAAGLLVLTSAVADSPVPNKQVDPKADQVLKDMGTLLAKTKSFSVDAKVEQDLVLADGQKIEMSSRRSFTVSRPNHIRATSAGDLDIMDAWYAVNKLTVLNRQTKEYTTLDVPDKIDAMFDDMVNRFGLVLPMADLLVSDPYGSAMQNTWAGFYIGLHEVNGVACHHLAFRADSVDWQIWVDSGEKPLPRKLVITFSTVSGQPKWSAELDNWNLSPKVDDAMFTFAPGQGMTQVDAQKLLSSKSPAPVPGKTP